MKVRVAPFLLSLLAACSTSARQTASQLPEASVVDLRGAPTSLRQLTRGRVVLIDLWATWCDACEKERPKLERLAEAYARQGLLVVGINVGEPTDVVSEYQSRRPFRYPIYLDPEFRFADALAEDRIPSLLVVTSDGRVAHRSSRVDRALLERISQLLPGDTGPSSAASALK